MEPASQLQPVRLALISEGWPTWPLYVAQEKRLFEKEGVNVDVTLTGSSVMQLEKLIRGEFDIGFQQSDHVVRGVEGGADLFIFMAQGHAPDLSLVVAPGIGTFADLKDKVIAVDGARTGYALCVAKTPERQRIEGRRFHVQEIGGSQERFEALKGGAASASLLTRRSTAICSPRASAVSVRINGFFPAYPGSIAARHGARGRSAMKNNWSRSSVLSTPATRGCKIPATGRSDPDAAGAPRLSIRPRQRRSKRFAKRPHRKSPPRGCSRSSM